ncbi:MAG TPA: hypothetical protein VMW29_04025 [Candidatus Bathyarchaeia archaeon]|nr:hypothetical protein [Candidatus Bathyarchaeia archaeon]
MVDDESQRFPQPYKVDLANIRRAIENSSRRGPAPNRITNADWKHVSRTKDHLHLSERAKLAWAVKHIFGKEKPRLNSREANDFFYLVFHVLSDEHPALPDLRLSAQRTAEEQRRQQERQALLKKRVAVTQTADAIIKPGTSPDAKETLEQRLAGFSETEKGDLKTAVTTTQELIGQIGIDPDTAVRAATNLAAIFSPHFPQSESVKSPAGSDTVAAAE